MNKQKLILLSWCLTLGRRNNERGLQRCWSNHLDKNKFSSLLIVFNSISKFSLFENFASHVLANISRLSSFRSAKILISDYATDVRGYAFDFLISSSTSRQTRTYDLKQKGQRNG